MSLTCFIYNKLYYLNLDKNNIDSLFIYNQANVDNNIIYTCIFTIIDICTFWYIVP